MLRRSHLKWLTESIFKCFYNFYLTKVKIDFCDFHDFVDKKFENWNFFRTSDFKVFKQAEWTLDSLRGLVWTPLVVALEEHQNHFFARFVVCLRLLRFLWFFATKSGKLKFFQDHQLEELQVTRVDSRTTRGFGLDVPGGWVRGARKPLFSRSLVKAPKNAIFEWL